jgi:hypothetical protein
MSFDNTSKISDIIASLEDNVGVNGKSDLAVAIGGTALTTDNMQTLIAKLKASVPTANVLAGTTIASQAGTMPNKAGSGTVLTVSTSDQAIPKGYYGGASTDGKVKGEPALLASNILPTATIGGVTGTYSNIKSYQNGYTSIPAYTPAGVSVTISAVDLTKAIVIVHCPPTGNINSVTAVFTNSTTITFTPPFSSASSVPAIYWEVYEFNNVKSLQRGSYTGVGTITVSNYNVAKSMLFYSYTSSASAQNIMAVMVKYNSTTIQVVELDSAGITCWQLIEFY